MMFPRLFQFHSLVKYKINNFQKLAASFQINGKKMLTTCVTSASGIDTGSVTNLPSGVTGKEEIIDGKTLFSIEEGLAKVYFSASTPEEVFYNPGLLFTCYPLLGYILYRKFQTYFPKIKLLIIFF